MNKRGINHIFPDFVIIGTLFALMGWSPQQLPSVIGKLVDGAGSEKRHFRGRFQEEEDKLNSLKKCKNVSFSQETGDL